MQAQTINEQKTLTDAQWDSVPESQRQAICDAFFALMEEAA
jgi:hypothetical protein